MAKAPFKNLRDPATNTNASPRAPVMPDCPPQDERQANGARVNAGVTQDGEKPLAWPKPEVGPKPMRLKNGG